MKKSKNVAISSVLLAGMVFATSACSSEPDQEFMDEPADHQQICVQVSQDGQHLLRGEDGNCPSDEDNNGQSSFHPGFWYWYYLGRAYGTPPAYGKTIPVTAPGSFSRPSGGTIAKAPASGGFGTTRVSVGG